MTKIKAANARVFEDEDQFWNADNKIRSKSRPFVVIDRATHKTYYVWTMAKVTAIGLVAQYLDVFNVSPADRQEGMFESDTDALFAAIKKMPPQMREKLIRIAQLECPFCDEKCNSQGGLTLHLKAKHKEEYANLLAQQEAEEE